MLVPKVKTIVLTRMALVLNVLTINHPYKVRKQHYCMMI